MGWGRQEKDGGRLGKACGCWGAADGSWECAFHTEHLLGRLQFAQLVGQYTQDAQCNRAKEFLAIVLPTCLLISVSCSESLRLESQTG